IWTSNLGLTILILQVALLVLFTPFAVSFIEALYTGPSFYYAIVSSLEPLFLGSIAFSTFSTLNYFESQNDFDLGIVPAILSCLSALSTACGLMGFFVAHFLRRQIFDPGHDSGTFVLTSIIFVWISVTISFVTIAQGRRVKDLIRKEHSI